LMCGPVRTPDHELLKKKRLTSTSLSRGDCELLQSTNIGFCKAGTFYLVFKEHRTRNDGP